jgi:site-specific DNA-methyltransferase (adenine-specific)
MPMDTLKPATYNPRTITERALSGLKNSIDRFGAVSPIVWNERTGNIVGGHQRYKVLLEEGETETDVVVVDLSLDEEMALNIALNNPAIQGDWSDDIEALLKKFKPVDEIFQGLRFDDLAEALDLDLDPSSSKGPDKAPPVPRIAKSKECILYQLGRHRLQCGDSTMTGDVDFLMGGKMANLFLTDPPYNVAYEGKTEESLKIDNDSMSAADYRKFLAVAFGQADRNMEKGAVFYVWHADSEGYNVRGACYDIEWQVRQCLIWVKNSMVMGRQDYQWKHEPCLYGWKSGAGHFWASDRKQTTVLEFDRPSASREHPTMKPVELFSYLAENSSRKDNIILDLFAGSGTTVIVAEKTGRIAYVMEKDPRYVDVIRQRWAEFVHGEGCDWESLTPEIGQSSKA